MKKSLRHLANHSPNFYMGVKKCEILLRFFNIFKSPCFETGQQNGNLQRTWERRVLSSANLVQIDPPNYENGLTESPLKTGGKCWIVNNSVIHCPIMLKFGRHYAQNDATSEGLKLQCLKAMQLPPFLVFFHVSVLNFCSEYWQLSYFSLP